MITLSAVLTVLLAPVALLGAVIETVHPSQPEWRDDR